MKTVLQLVKEWCANFELTGPYDKKFFCLREIEKDNHQCGYFTQENYNCKYLEKSVLGLDKQTEAIYYAEQQAKKDNHKLSLKQRKEIKEESKTTKECSKCKKDFVPTNHRQKYCNKCKKDVQKEQSRIRNRGRKKSGRKDEFKLTL